MNTFNRTLIKTEKDPPRCDRSWWADPKAQTDRDEFDRIVAERFPVMQSRGVTYHFEWVDPT